MRKQTIIYYPRMRQRSDLADTLGRAAWYFQPWIAGIEKILIGSETPVSVSALDVPDIFDEDVKERLSALAPLISIQNLSDGELVVAAGADSDVVLLNWDARNPPPAELVAKLRAKGRYYQVDAHRTRNEGSFYLWAGRNAFGATDAAIAESKRALERLAEAVRQESVYIFGTGPSLASLSSYDFPDGQAIAVNSMVRNTELLDRLDLLAIASGDPIFHAGCSRYAGAFRKQLVACLERYGSFLLVPLRDFEMYKSFVPATHHERIVGLPFDANKPYNLDLRAQFYVNPKPNALTLLLLPAAATLFKTILVGGCDGRPLSENKYFWSHDKKSQFNDEMDNIKRVHPAFFEISYDEYYAEHVRTVGQVVDAIEAKGQRIESLTPSFIPALGSRYRGVKHPRIFCIDPDGVSEQGHFLNYDDMLAGEATRRGVEFSVLGPVDAQPGVKEARPHFRPAFSCRSWRLRGSAPLNAADLAKFRAELAGALSEADCIDQEIVLFMYCGSIETAQVIAEILEAFPGASACINLFWLSFMDIRDGEYVRKWQASLSRLSQSSQITLTASSTELAEEIEAAFGVRVAALPHPSTTFEDRGPSDAAGRPSREGAIRVLFPGSGTGGKGWTETVAALPLLNQELGDRCDFFLRVAPGSPEVAQFRDILGSILTKTELIEGVLSRDGFTEMITRSDIVVLPYDPRAFRNRTSGLFVDALHAGKPIVAAKGSWLGNRIEEYECGVAVEGNTPEQLLEGVTSVLASYEKYAAAASAARLRFAERNSWKTLLDTILAAADRAALARSNGVPANERQTTADTPGGSMPTVLSPDAALHADAGGSVELQRRKDEIVEQLPVRAAIFLPTERIPLGEQVRGLDRVLSVFKSELEQIDRPRLRGLRGRHLGQRRCFIIGNGPSLNKTDLSCLAGEVTFATNGFFLKAKTLNWLPTYYVVEDHLVAEDRAKWINEFSGPTKLFPANLAYCLARDENTIFFDLRPRKSYPHGFDFSTDASQLVYAGGTVTFTCIQLAYYFGFREIYLVGVDADYRIPRDAKVVGRTGVSELDMKSDDPNHFDPDYFGKGFRWHDPNVDRMLAAYAEAKKVTDASGSCRIYNATIGGKLEVFPRVSYEGLFASTDHVGLPRTLLIDISPFGEATATGELKRTYFGHFPANDLLHLSAAGWGQLCLAPGGDSDGPDARLLDAGDPSLERICRAFDPELIIYRPVSDRPDLHKVAMRFIQQFGKPWVVWLMDDWPERLRVRNPPQFAIFDRDLRELLRGATDRFAISEAMAEAFASRYGVAFQVFRNGASPAQWQTLRHAPASDGAVRIRYAGNLAPDTTFDSVYDVARAVEEIAARHPVRLEIRTHANWYPAAVERYANIKHVTLETSEADDSGYRQWLVDADILLLAYNFDPETIRYLGYSFANKTPEYLASGAVVLAYGPREIATIRFLSECDVAVVVDARDKIRLAEAIEELVVDKAKRARLGKAGRRLAWDHLNLEDQQARFASALNAAAGRASLPEAAQASRLASIPLSRDQKAQLDECRLVFETLKGAIGSGGVMVDVGAHHGSSLNRFAEAGWTVYAFEPDPTNREKLMNRHGAKPNVLISEEAVCDVSGQMLPFYASEESTGISGLSAFRDSHREVAKVRAVTLSEVVARHGLVKVDCLKIDVEGFEMAVLRGLDFGRLKPSVIVAEFEDSKTRSLGYTSHHLARLLEDQGYTVYVSEWHPVERYGVKHSWRRIRKYPCDIAGDAWGNLIAYQQSPKVGELIKAVRVAADMPVQFVGYADVVESGIPTRATAATPGKPHRRSDQMLRKLFRLVRRPIIVGAVALTAALLAAAAATGALPESWLGDLESSVLFSVVAANLLFTAVATGAAYAYLKSRFKSLRRAIHSRIDELASIEAAHTTAIERLVRQVGATEAKIPETRKQLATLIDALDKRVARQSATFSRLNAANASRARQHARLLDDAALARLEKHWAPLFGLHLRPSALAYLAHQICIAEDRCDGRLATTIETAMLRQLALRSLPGPEIDLLEIGTLFGIGGGLLYRLRGDRITRLRVTLVDPLNGYYAAGEPDPVTGVMVGVDTVKRNLRALDVPEEDVVLLQGLSTDEGIVAAAKQRRYDFALIDGDHSGAGVRRDFELYGPLIRPGGLVLFDDYDTKEWPEIKPAVDDLMKTAEGWEWVGAEWRTGIARRLPSGGR